MTEDWGIDDHQQTSVKAPEDYFQFIYSPLPLDLPLIDKDKLIIIAAQHGDIDRYTRLRRPYMICTEPENIIHGIFHNAYFAKWWSAQIPEYPPQEEGLKVDIRRAINARRIMSNDISWVNTETPFYLLPENIWFPSVAAPITYLRLAHTNPAMFISCLRACIVAGAHKIWDELLRSPPEGIPDFRHPHALGEPEDPKLWRLSRIVGQALLRLKSLRKNHS